MMIWRRIKAGAYWAENGHLRLDAFLTDDREWAWMLTTGGRMLQTGRAFSLLKAKSLAEKAADEALKVENPA